MGWLLAGSWNLDPKNVDRTVAALVASQDNARSVSSTREAAKKRLADAEARLHRFQTAIAAGVDATALVEPINQAQARHRASRTERRTRTNRAH